VQRLSLTAATVAARAARSVHVIDPEAEQMAPEHKTRTRRNTEGVSNKIASTPRTLDAPTKFALTAPT
jgi:hypothetical protein